MVFTEGTGFTVMEKYPVVPVHPFAEGVTDILAVAGKTEFNIAVNGWILPLPERLKPIDGRLFVHEKDEAVTGPENAGI